MKKEGALPGEEGTREKGWGYRGWEMEDEESYMCMKNVTV